MREQAYRPSPLLRWLPIAVLLVILIFALIALAAAVFEGVVWGRWLVPTLLVLTAYFAYNAWQVAYTLTLHQDHLTRRRFGRESTLSYSDIVRGVLGRNTLTLHTIDGKMSFYGAPDQLARLRAELEARVPALARQRNGRRTRSLPIHYRKDLLSYLAGPLALILLALLWLALLAWAWYAGSFTPGLEDGLVTLLLGFTAGVILWAGVGMLIGFVPRVTFDETTITVHRWRHDETYASDDLRDIRLRARQRTVRGVARTFYTLQLHFDGETGPVEIGPTFSDSLGIRQEQVRQELADLRQALLQHYSLVTQVVERDRPLPQNEWGRGHLRRRFTFRAYDLAVREEDYGEHHMGATAVHFVFSRPLVEDVTRFRTTNGDLQHSHDGRFLVIHDFTQLVLFDLSGEAAYHYRLERGWQLQQVRLEAGQLRVQTLSLTRPPRTAVLDPVPLTPEDLSRRLVAGSGTHPPGNFPSAWPSRAPAPPPPTRKPADPAYAVAGYLAHARALGSRLPEAAESLRDNLHDLGPEALPHILEAARTAEGENLLEILVMVLVDSVYPPAFPHFLDWLDHPNAEIRFFCAWALDSLAEGRFGIPQMMDGGFVQHDRIKATIPQIKEWWHHSGRQRVPSLAQWRRQLDAQQPITEVEKWFNFVELNPLWVKFGDGTVAPQARGFRLPRRMGTHIVAGQVWLTDASDPVFAAFVMESDLGWVSGVYVKEGDRWLEVSDRMVRAQPNFSF